MKCSHCGSTNTVVKDSRPNDTETLRRRRYHCNACGKRFTTYEIYDTGYDGMIEIYVLDALKSKGIIGRAKEAQV